MIRTLIERFSLRARLLLAVGVVTLVALLLADFAVYSALRTYLFNRVDTTIAAAHDAVAKSSVNPDKPASSSSSSSPASNVPGASHFCSIGRESAPGMFIEVLDNANRVVVGANGREQCPAYTPGNEQYLPKLPANLAELAGAGSAIEGSTIYLTVESTEEGGPPFRVRADDLRSGGTLVLADPIGNLENTLAQLVIVEMLVTGAALAIAALLGAWLVRVGLRPLRDVERTAAAITAGDLVQRVPNQNSRTEVGQVAMALNIMLEKIQANFEELRASENRLRRFVGDASHELRTPIAAVSGYAQLFRRGASERIEDLNRLMAGIERESTRMTKLVEDLLTLAKIDENQVLDPQPIELVGLAAEAVETAMTVGPQWPVSIAAEDAVEVLGNETALRQVLDNLLANVRAHTPEGTKAVVTVRREGANACVEVADNGPGFRDVEGPLLFERFFRADSSRSRDTGGAGLGLAIVALIVQAHGGTAEAQPGAEGGAVFRVRLPAIVEEAA